MNAPPNVPPGLEWLPELLSGASTQRPVVVVINVNAHQAGPPPPPRPAAQRLRLADAGQHGTVELFAAHWITGALPVPATAARTEDLYRAYRVWARQEGVRHPMPINGFLPRVAAAIGSTKRRLWHLAPKASAPRQSMVVMPHNAQHGVNQAELGEVLDAFGRAVHEWAASL